MDTNSLTGVVNGAGNPPAQLSWGCVMFLLGIFGAFGGVLNVLQFLDVRRFLSVKDIAVIGKAGKFWVAILLGLFGGIGGAWSILLIGIWTNQITFVDDTRNHLLLASLGMVSGFIGYKLLKMVSSNLEKQIRDSELKTADLINETKNQIIEDDNILDKARMVRDDPNALPSAIEEMTKELIPVARRRPTDRVVAMLLGNLLDRIGKHAEAIDVVTKTLEAKRKLGNCADKDTADLLFNRACYRMPLFKKSENGHQKDAIKEEIYKDLERSFELSPANKEEAQNGDEDLAPLVNEDRFKKI